MISRLCVCNVLAAWSPLITHIAGLDPLYLQAFYKFTLAAFLIGFCYEALVLFPKCLVLSEDG